MPVDSNQRQYTAGEYEEVKPYCTVEFANEHAGNYLEGMTYWGELNDAQKLAALRQATLELDQMVYEGARLYPNTQQREWPRFLNLGTLSTVFYLNERIPLDVAKACAVQAMWHAKNLITGHDPAGRQDAQFQGLTGLNRAGGQESWDLNKSRRHRLCRESYELVRPYLLKSGTMTDGFDVGIGRRF